MRLGTNDGYACIHMIYKQILIATSLVFALSIGGCSSWSTKSASTSPSAAAPAIEPDPVASRPFENDTVYELLLAEFAGKRNRADVALGKYLKQAHETRDPQVVERAAFIARFLGAHQATLDASKLWLEIEPNNPAPRELAATELIRFGQMEEALHQIDQLMASEGDLNFEFLLQATRASDRETRQKVLDKLSQYAPSSEDARLWYAKGSLQAMNGTHESALMDFDKALALSGGYGNAILAKFQSLTALNRQQEAMTFLAQETSRHPENKRLGVTYARQLMKQNQLKAAQQQFYRLSKNFPHDGDLVLSLALLSWENQERELAREQFNKLLETNHRTDEAHLYLARMAVGEKDFDRAQTHLKLVGPGRQYLSAQVQLAIIQTEQGQLDQALATLDNAAAQDPKQHLKFLLAKTEILAKKERFEEAIELLDKGLEQAPDDTNLLYSRAMLREQNDNFEGMEADLRRVLELQPNNSAALNALGYTFANRNHRLSEAWELIEKAYTLNPDDPAIIDSMGWIKYRMGDVSEALNYLKKAYAAFDDQEIAAHLGEVLWVSGQQDEAREIWEEALEKSPDSKILKEVMDRFLPSQTN